MGTIQTVQDGYLLRFEYDRRISYVIKGAKGSLYNKSSREWFIPSSPENEQIIQVLIDSYDFTNMDNVTPEYIGEVPPMPELLQTINLKVTPYDFQKQGIAYSIQAKRLIIGDKPGLGKTIQAMATVVALNAFPCLVICPASLKYNWQIEWSKFTYEKAEILTDGIKNTWPYFYDAGLVNVFITNYESLGKYFVRKINTPRGQKMKLSDIEFSGNIKYFRSIIVDESHRVKDPAAQQSKFVAGVAHGKPVVMLLSGTPVVNKEKDLISQLAIIDRLKDLGGQKTYKDRYCGAKYYRELNYKLRTTCFFSREKFDVLKELPAKVRQIVSCEITTQPEYDVAMADLATYLVEYRNATDAQVRKSLKGEIMVRIGILKNVSARGKIADVVDYVNDIVEAEEKIILFCHLKEVANALKSAFPEALTVLGEDNTAERQQAVESFQNDDSKKVIICSIKAAGVGLTLTASSRVAFIELPWHPADCEQCEDRAHRIGQTDSVQCTYFLGRNTIDESIYQLIDEKRSMCNAITGAREEVETSMIDNIINLLNNKQL
ncbi:MAG: DEAD/DEAH box helicase [Bacteroidales bacterium]|jgi:SWI/SNF-related matrix-associated actin-dependent regulator 1 of chromatin subfamily A